MESLVNPERQEAFGDRMMNILNEGALSLMISIGHRTGLFDAMDGMTPSTSKQIAEAAGLNERYVREWLGAMTTGKIVDCNSNGPLYSLPAEHAAWLTRQATPDNIAVFAQYIPLLGTVEDKVIDCFYKGGGVPYSEFKRFHEVMAEDSGQTVVAALTDSILPLVPGLIEALESGISVLDVGCGSGRALNLMAKAYPNSDFTGYDISFEAIDRAKKEAKGNRNITFEVKDVTNLEDDKCFDLITAFDAIHDQINPAAVLEGISKRLCPTGVFLMQDIAASSHVCNNKSHPIGPLLYTLSCMHCMTVSLAEKGAGLGAMWGQETATEMLKEAGFKNIEVKKLAHDFQNYFYIASK